LTDQNGAAAPVDAQPQAVADESEQATQTPETSSEGAAPENAETPKADEADGQQPDDDKPKKPSRYDRMKRRIQALATEAESLRAQLSANAAPAPVEGPKEADFNGDYFAYQAAKIAHETKQALREEINADRHRSQSEREQSLRREMVEEFEERAEEYRAKIPDFDKTIEAYVQQGGKFSPALSEELQQSEMGPQLAYVIAKNPQLASQLNAMSPREVAREIGRLEAKAALPNPRKQTSAPPPHTQLKGGAAPSKSVAELAKGEDVSELLRVWREKKKGA
jgi:hypothetical protein